MRALSLWARSRSMIDRDAQIRVTDHSKMSFLIDKCMAKFSKSIETSHTIKAVTTDRQSARNSMSTKKVGSWKSVGVCGQFSELGITFIVSAYPWTVLVVGNEGPWRSPRKASLGRGQFSNREQFLAFQTDVRQRGRRLIVLDEIVGEDRGGSWSQWRRSWVCEGCGGAN